MGQMSAVVVNPDVPGHLEVRSVDEPTSLAPSDALVLMKATSLNLGEVHVSERAPAGTRLGWDVAGIVERQAANGSGPPAGARVVGLLRSGAWAELVAVPTQALVELPANVSYAQAATLPVAGLTALYALERGTGLLGRNVLVTGASGGVGHFAVQLGRLIGARVTGLIRTEQYKDRTYEAGADHVVVSEKVTEARAFGPYRLVVESVGGRVLGDALGMLSPDGVCVALGVSSGSPDFTASPWPLIRTGRVSLYGFLLFNELVREPASEGLARLGALVAEDRVRPHIAVEAPWLDIAKIAQDFLARRIPGKAVLHFD